MLWMKNQSFNIKLDSFQEEGVTGEMLLKIHESDLKDMGINRLADRKAIIFQIKKLAYYECYPDLLNDQSTTGGDSPDPSQPSTRASSKQSSRGLVSEPISSCGSKEFDPLAPSFMVKAARRFTWFYSGLVVVWELCMNILSLHPLLHIIALVPGFMGTLESISWWYRV